MQIKGDLNISKKCEAVPLVWLPFRRIYTCPESAEEEKKKTFWKAGVKVAAVRRTKAASEVCRLTVSPAVVVVLAERSELIHTHLYFTSPHDGAVQVSPWL